MPASGNFRKGTDKFMRQGHTVSSPYGRDHNATATGQAGQPAREVKP